jgi:hypothetical protein
MESIVKFSQVIDTSCGYGILIAPISCVFEGLFSWAVLRGNLRDPIIFVGETGAQTGAASSAPTRNGGRKAGAAEAGPYTHQELGAALRGSLRFSGQAG